VREAWNTSKSAHGPWRLSKTPALAIAPPLRFFTNLGLPSLAIRWEFNSSNRRIRDPYVRWCGREGPRGYFLSRFGVKEAHFAAPANRWHNRGMKIAIELNEAQTQRLQTIAASLGVDAQELAQAAVADLVSTSADDFESAASRVLQKNRELYQRLA
jgi:hypothetical protein